MTSSQRRFWLATAAVGTGGCGGRLWFSPVARRGNRPRRPPIPPPLQALLAAPLPDVKGEPQALERWRGRVLIINFWATWCAPCRKEIPEFVRMQERYGARGLQFVGIAFDQPEKVREFAREFGINYPLLMGGLDTMALMRETGNRVGRSALHLVLDRQGNVVSRLPGGLTEEKLEAIVRPLL